MGLDDAIKAIEERKKMWEEYAKRVYDCLYRNCEELVELLKKLMGEDYDGNRLISDHYYDHECAWIVVSELEKVISILKKAKGD